MMLALRLKRPNSLTHQQYAKYVKHKQTCWGAAEQV
jgi:hypothetical protein